MLFAIGFGILTLVLILVITAIVQPPHRWVEHFAARKASKFPAKKSAGPPKQD